MIYKKFVFLGKLSDAIMRVNADGSTSTIPNAPGNRDWEEYQRWLEAGNVPEPAE